MDSNKAVEKTKNVLSHLNDIVVLLKFFANAGIFIVLSFLTVYLVTSLGNITGIVNPDMLQAIDPNAFFGG